MRRSLRLLKRQPLRPEHSGGFGASAAEKKPVEFFGGPKRRDDALLRAEELVTSWRALLHPNAACGSRSYTLLGSLANLERALMDYAQDVLLRSSDFETLHVDDILPLSTTEACGVTNLREDHQHPMQYLVENQDGYCLSGTAEMGIADRLRGRRFRVNELPRFYTATSRCFRPEVSKSQHESGLYRVHEFNKIEMFAVCTAKQSDDVLTKIVDIQKRIFAPLDLHFRLCDMPADDLSAAASRKFDVEAWMPGRQVWGEVSSASACTDYQSRRLDIRVIADNGAEEACYAYTCNGTAMATSRMLIALLETHQNAKQKRVNMPEVLKPYLPSARSPGLRLKNALNHEYNP